jgi:hypothetical protein
MRALLLFACAAALASDLHVAGVGSLPPDAASFQSVPVPALRTRQNEAQATTAPWIDSNAWRYQRGLRKAKYETLPAGSASLAAAEAFAFGADAILYPNAADREELGRMLAFLKAQDQPPMPALANIGVVDEKSPAMDEILNMLTRRNLLYRVVSAPDRKLDVNVQLGTKDIPRESAANPSDFAARVRAKLTDDKRLVRLYGGTSTIARLTGDGKRVRLFLLTYGRGRSQQGLRIRVLGKWRPVNFAGFGAAEGAALTDVENPGSATEFSVPAHNVIAIIDLAPLSR